MKPRPLYDKKTGALTGYQLRVYAGDRPDGKKIILARNWRFDPKLPISKIDRELMRQQLLFEDEVQANSAAIELQNGYVPERPFTDTVNTKEPKYSFKEFTEFWLSAQYNLKQKTLDTYESKLKRINDCFGEKALDGIESIDIVGFLKDLREDGANLRNGKPLSMKSVREYYVLLKNVFDSACGWNKLDNNPVDAVSIPKSKYKKVKALTEDEAVTFYNALIEHAPAKYRAYLLLCLQTGTHRAEAGGLRWDKVMFDEKQIRIDSTVQYSPNKGINDETPKTESSVRTLKITPDIVKALRELKTEDDAARKAMGKERNGIPRDMFSLHTTAVPCTRTRPTHGCSVFKNNTASRGALSTSSGTPTRPC